MSRASLIFPRILSPQINIRIADVIKITRVKNWPINEIRRRFKFSRLIPKQLMMHKTKNRRPKMQRIIPRKLNGFNEVEFFVVTDGIWFIFRCSNELHRPMMKIRKPNLEISWKIMKNKTTFFQNIYMPLVNITPKVKYFNSPFTWLNSGFKHWESNEFRPDWGRLIFDEQHFLIGFINHFILEFNWFPIESWAVRSISGILLTLSSCWSYFRADDLFDASWDDDSMSILYD